MSWESLGDVETIGAARKEHRCEWCPEPIAVGESYKRAAGLDDGGEFYVQKMHPECWGAAGRSIPEGTPDDEAYYCDLVYPHPRGANCPDCEPVAIES